MRCQRVQFGDTIGFVCGPKPRVSKQKANPEPTGWPTSRHKMQLAGYRLQYARACKLCKAQIEFWKTPSGKLMPLDRRPDDTFMPHWSTCPNAADFRKKHNITQGELFK